MIQRRDESRICGDPHAAVTCLAKAATIAAIEDLKIADHPVPRLVLGC